MWIFSQLFEIALDFQILKFILIEKRIKIYIPGKDPTFKLAGLVLKILGKFEKSVIYPSPSHFRSPPSNNNKLENLFSYSKRKSIF